jgi:hypothetical protein
MRNPVIPLAWAAFFGFAMAQVTFAAPKSVFPDQSTDGAIPMAPVGSMKIVNTFMHTLDLDTVEAAETFVEIDSLSVTCPKTQTSCTIVFGMNIQATGGDNANNHWAICAVVDGSLVNGCPWQGELLPDANYGSAFSQQATTVTPGKHALQVQVYSEFGLTVGYVTIQYSVYAP